MADFTSGFSDYHFRAPEPTPEHPNSIEERSLAASAVAEPEDPPAMEETQPDQEPEAMAEEPAMTPAAASPEGMAPDRRTYEHKGHQFDVARTSTHAATVNIVCMEHSHPEFIVNRVEGEKGWTADSDESGSWHSSDRFLAAVQFCAEELAEECDAITQVDAFFADA